jgi:N-acetyltransferase
MALDLTGYFGRINYRGALEASLEVLQQLITAHTQRIPFENLDPLLGIPVDDLSAEALIDKLVHRRRGGLLRKQRPDGLRAGGNRFSGAQIGRPSGLDGAARARKGRTWLTSDSAGRRPRRRFALKPVASSRQRVSHIASRTAVTGWSCRRRCATNGSRCTNPQRGLRR